MGQNTFTWLQPVAGNFDGAYSWADITSGTPQLTPNVPGSLDIAEFNNVTVTVGSSGTGEAGTVDLFSSVVTMIGSVMFGALTVQSSTLDIASQATLDCVTGFQLTSQIAVEVGNGSELEVGGGGAVLTVHNPVDANAYLQVAAGATFVVAAGASVATDVLDFTGSPSQSAFGSVDGGGTMTDGSAELAAAWLAVGDGGLTALTVTNGALVSSSIITVGFGEAAGAGIGTLLIGAAAQIVASSYAALGYYARDDGVATIDGAGSMFASAGLFVGNSGNGALTVQNGATLATSVEDGDTTSFAVSIANASGGTGSVSLSGVGSIWTVAGRVDIGDGGAGTLDVVGGAAVEAAVGPVAIVNNGVTEYDGTFSLTDATVAVRDDGSTIDAGGGPIYIGNAGAANVSVGAGGAITAREPAPDYAAVQIGLNGGTGTLVVSDLGSRFTSLGQIDVGGTGGTANTGTLEVKAGATLFSGDDADDPLAGLSVGDGADSSGFGSIDGTGSALSNDGRLDIGRNGSGVLSITNGATLITELSGAAQTLQPASVLVGVNSGANGALFIAGNGSALIAAQSMIVGLGGTGTLEIIDAAAGQLGGDLGIGSPLRSGFTGNGRGLVSVAAGTLAVAGSLALGGASAGYSGSGTLSVAAGANVTVAGSVTITSGSTIALVGGGLEIGEAAESVTGLQVAAGATLAGAGTVQGSALVNGTIAAAGGVLTLGTSAGPGTYAVVAGATLDVGSLSGGTVNFAGSGTLRLHAPTLGTKLSVGIDGGTIDFANQAAGNPAFVDGALTVDVGTTTMTMELATTPPPGLPSIVSDGAGGTDLVLACFAAGTRLAAPTGQIAVETLRVGDELHTASGGVERVIWVGRRTLDCSRHPRPSEVRPVRVHAGAFARGLPSRDVLLSPDHALLVEGSLIPVRYLVNGSSIAQEAASRITYCHVELASHDVLLADGLPCESFLDTGNRAAFTKPGGPIMLHPEFTRPQVALAVWAAKGCAPLVLEGPALERARRHFLKRALALGYRRARDPALGVYCRGRALPANVAGTRWQVALPPDTGEIRLVSRTWVPAHMRPAENDTRTLGVAITRLELNGRRLALDSPALEAGWHEPERDWRWTDGAGALPAAGARQLAFDLVAMGEYWVRSPRPVAAPSARA